MARARDKFTVVRTSHLCPEGLSESVVKRRAGWFLQSDEALQYELRNGYYYAGIVPLFFASGLVNCADFGGVVGNIARDDFYNSSSNVSGWRG